MITIRPVLCLDGPKTAKRRMRCRVCGREIRKGETYWVEEFYEGPYKRRRALCTECAKRALYLHVRDLVLWSRWRATDECMMNTGTGLKAVEAAAITMLAPGLLTREREKHCQKIINENGFTVLFTKRETKIAEQMGIDLKKLVKQIDNSAIVNIKP